MPPEFVFDELEKVEKEASVKREDKTEKEEVYCNDNSKVQFNLETVVVNIIQSRGDMSITELSETWYQVSEFSRVTSWNRMTVKLMKQQGNLDNEPDHCIRGLEHRLKGEHERRKNLKINSIYAVLQEQSRQRSSKIKDLTTISDIYRHHTISCAAQAYEKGLQDRKAVQEEPVRRMTQRRSSIVFDDDDFKQLLELDLEDESERFEIRVMEEANPMGSKQRPIEEEYGDEETEEKGEKKKKRVKMRRVGSFFKRKNKRSASPKPNTISSAVGSTTHETTTTHQRPRRRFARRSSM